MQKLTLMLLVVAGCSSQSAPGDLLTLEGALDQCTVMNPCDPRCEQFCDRHPEWPICTGVCDGGGEPDASGGETPSADAGVPSSGDCSIVVTAGQSPTLSDVAASVEPGDVICLAGTFTTAHAIGSTGRNGVLLASLTANGTPEAPITLMGLPGGTHRIQGDFPPAGPTNLAVNVAGNYWVVRDLVLRTAIITVNNGATHDVWIVDNDVAEAVAPDGNFGLIRLLDGGDAGPFDIFVQDNYVHDLYTCASTATTPCAPGAAAIPWTTYSGENEACLTVQGTSGGVIEFRNNVVERCSSVLYFKRERPGLTVVEGNTFRDAQRLGRCRNLNMQFAGNTLANVGGLDASSDRCETR